ncbi:MAG: DUF5020 family protein [Bacteroides sp.]|nr:DUF5020 family protein [Bacteroides sp.]
MKRIILPLLLLVAAVAGASAQNIQLHYDFGRALYDELDTDANRRPRLTTTVEMFKPDKWGSTFFFVDMDYADNEVKSAYWEISRKLKFWQAPISLQLEYDGGLNYIKDSYLAGLSYGWDKKDFSAGFSLSALYKYLCSNYSNSYQLTATWYWNFCGGKCSFSGFADFWREEHTDMEGKAHDYTFIAEPQFWVNLNKFRGVSDAFRLSIGTEWEVSHNFALLSGWYLNPTLALKWEF